MGSRMTIAGAGVYVLDIALLRQFSYIILNNVSLGILFLDLLIVATFMFVMGLSRPSSNAALNNKRLVKGLFLIAISFPIGGLMAFSNIGIDFVFGIQFFLLFSGCYLFYTAKKAPQNQEQSRLRLAQNN